MFFRNLLPALQTISLLLWLAPTSLSQLALASSSYLDQSGTGIQDTHFRSLFTEVAGTKPKRNIPVVYESEIAAIFKNVAYGTSPFTSTSSSTTTTTTTTTTTPRPRTSSTQEPGEQVFIGQQKEVRINVDLVNGALPAPRLAFSTEKPLVVTQPPFTYLTRPRANSKESDRIPSVSSSFPPPSIEDVQVQISSEIKMQEYHEIYKEIQSAWYMHVYATGVLFTITALICMFLLTRLHLCSEMLPRGYFITIVTMIFMCSFFRSVLFFNDPFGAYQKLPKVLINLLHHTSVPCLTTAYAVFLLVLLRASKLHMFPERVQSPLVVAVICACHIGFSVIADVLSGVITDATTLVTIKIIIQASTIAWSAFLCLIYTISFSSIQKAADKQKEDLSRGSLGRNSISQQIGTNKLYKSPSWPNMTYASRIFFVVSLFQCLLCIFWIVSLARDDIPKVEDPADAWGWWIHKTMERLTELLFCGLVVATVVMLMASSTTGDASKSRSELLSIFSLYRPTTVGAKAISSYPDKCNIMSNGSLISGSPNSSMSWAYNGWKKNNCIAEDQGPTPIPLGDVTEELKQFKSLFAPIDMDRRCGTYKGTRVSEPLYEHCDNHRRAVQQYLTKDAPMMQPSLTKPQGYRSHPNGDIKHLDLIRAPAYRCENEYEVASYYHPTSSGANVYSKPYNCCYTVSSEVGVHTSNSSYLKPGAELSAGSSEIQVDYLTDASSVDGLESLSRSVTLPYIQENALPVPQRPQTLVFNKSCVDHPNHRQDPRLTEAIGV